MENNILQQINSFLQQIILGVPLYRWTLALIVFFLFIFFRKLFTAVVLKAFKLTVSKTKTQIDDKLLKAIEAPLKFLFIIFGLWFALDILNIETEITKHVIRSLFIYDIFWIAYNSINVFTPEIHKFTQKFGKDLYKEFATLFIKSAKAFVFILGIVAVLQEWGINVTALIASLGLGGLAFALAAKDTVANFFGGLTILADRSMKIGEWVKTGSIEGIVEDIGIRTTKIRTFEKGLITVPNSYIANNPLENFSRRNVRRILAKIGLVYSTKKEQIDNIIKDIRNLLENHPKIATDQTIAVYFDEFADSSLNILIVCYTDTSNWLEWLDIKQDIYYKIMEIVEKNGSSFAFPSRSIYVENIPEIKVKEG